MHAVLADKSRLPATIQEGKAIDMSEEEIIKTEESKKKKSISDIAFASKFVGQMSRTRQGSEDEPNGGTDDPAAK